MKVCLHKESFTKKPEKSRIASLVNEMNGNNVDLPIEELANEISVKGRTVCAQLKGPKKDKNWLCQRLVFLDFDEGNFTEVVDFMKKYNLIPAFAYETFSSKPDFIKFRAVYDIGQDIDNPKLMKKILKLFQGIFKDLKPCGSSFILSSFFFGGCKGVIKEITTYKPVCWDYLISVYLDVNKTSSRDKGDERLLKSLANLKSVQNSSSPKGYLIGSGDFGTLFEEVLDILFKSPQDASKVRENPKVAQAPSDLKVFKRDDDIFYNICPAYRDILNGLEQPHQVKFNLATNVAYFLNQREDFKKALIRLSPDWKRQYNTILHNKYKPLSCSSQCRYRCFKNLYKTATDTVIEIKSNQKEEYNTVEKAYSEIKSIIDDIIAKPDNKVHVIYCQTGIGKTELALDYDIPKFFPTHELKQEVITRFIKKYPEKPKPTQTPDLPNLPEGILSKIKYLYKIGCWQSAESLLDKYSPDYMKSKKAPIKGNHFSTHAKLLQSPQIDDEVIIVDEDITSDLISVTTHSKIELATFVEKLTNDDMKHHIEDLVDLGYSEKVITKETPYFKSWYSDYCKNNKVSSNLKEILHSKYLYSDSDKIFVGRIKKLPKNKTIIILSATPFKFAYEKLIPNRFVYHDIKPVKYVGKLIQYAEMSFSRNQIRKANFDDDWFKSIKDWCTDNEIACITYKNISDKLNEKDCCYFGNLRGYDYLSGKNLLIIGTHKVPEQAVKIISKMLGEVVSETDKRNNIKIERNGKQLTYNTFENPSLQAIDLYLTEREMEQSVGRCRLVRNNVECLVISKYPLAQSIIYNKEVS